MVDRVVLGKGKVVLEAVNGQVDAMTSGDRDQALKCRVHDGGPLIPDAKPKTLFALPLVVNWLIAPARRRSQKALP